ncbi:Peroxide-responsive repressor PerR [Geobacter sulfurreducens]|nr:Peroxide-responsive repressor PerR [Geobacter sulfurreducens]
MEQRVQFKQSKLQALEAGCRQNGLAMTVQRRVIMEALAERTDHPTADQLYDTVKGRLRGISRTTVYRVLETLVGIGVAQKISNPEAKARFDANTERHHHAVCSRCQRVSDIHDPQLNSLPMPAGEIGGFVITDYSINFSGLCADCR